MFLLGIVKLDVQPYDEDEGTGELRYVQVGSILTLYLSLDALVLGVVLSKIMKTLFI